MAKTRSLAARVFADSNGTTGGACAWSSQRLPLIHVAGCGTNWPSSLVHAGHDFCRAMACSNSSSSSVLGASLSNAFCAAGLAVLRGYAAQNASKPGHPALPRDEAHQHITMKPDENIERDQKAHRQRKTHQMRRARLILPPDLFAGLGKEKAVLHLGNQFSREADQTMPREIRP